MKQGQNRSSTLVIFSLGGSRRVGRLISHSAFSFRSIIWIDPFLDADYSTFFKRAKQVDKIEALLSAEGNHVEINEYSLSELYSTTPKTSALKSLMPGLKAIGTISVPTVTDEVLASRLTDLVEPVTVVIDCPGQEHVVLAFLETSGLLKEVDTLFLRAGVEPFFEGAHAIGDLAQMLETNALLAGEIYDDVDPDWPIYKFQSDQRTRLVHDLRAQLVDVAQARDAADNAAAEMQKKLSERDEDLDRITQETKQKNAELQRLTKERDAAKISDAQSRDDLARKVQESVAHSNEVKNLKQELDKVETTLAETQKRLAEGEAILTRRNLDIEERDKKIAQLEETLKKLRKENTVQQALNKEKTTRLSYEAQQLRLDLRRATAVQDALQSEKDSLRSSKKAIKGENQQLRQLLQQLTPKLREAAEQVRKITSPPQASSILNEKSTKSVKATAGDCDE